MAANGFDFKLLPQGEIEVNQSNHEIETVTQNDLKVQLSYSRIKSITHDWFIDNIGANLEELIGQHCTQDIVEYGKQKILDVLTYDKLWLSHEVFIMATIKNNVLIEYNIYLKLYDPEDTTVNPISTTTNDPYCYEINVTLDLVKGVYVRLGWNPKRTGNFAGIDYKRSIPAPEQR